ncbi:MAG: helix-turn-helix domain-containing protein, partial [Pseudomonadota bacterium]|nr:helix-turn-helix domain-containing protein [Pseudomonadota bacterium]
VIVARNCQSFRHQSLRESLLKPQRITPALIGKDQLSQRSMPLVLYQPPENLTPGGFPNGRKRDSMQHALIRGAGSMPTIEITRQDLSISQLRAGARTTDVKQARRILAIAMVLDGHSRLLTAQACGRERQTLRGWVHRYNARSGATNGRHGIGRRASGQSRKRLEPQRRRSSENTRGAGRMDTNDSRIANQMMLENPNAGASVQSRPIQGCNFCPPAEGAASSNANPKESPNCRSPQS